MGRNRTEYHRKVPDATGSKGEKDPQFYNDHVGAHIKTQPILGRSTLSNGKGKELFLRHPEFCRNHLTPFENTRAELWNKLPFMNAFSVCNSRLIESNQGEKGSTSLDSSTQSLVNLIRVFIGKVFDWVQMKFLKVLFPRGIIYNGGQLSLIEFVTNESPIIFIASGPSRLSHLFIQSVLSHHNYDLSLRTFNMSFLDSLEPPSGAFGDLFRFPKRQFAKSQTSLDEAVSSIANMVSENMNIIVSVDEANSQSFLLTLFDSLLRFSETGKNIKIVTASVSCSPTLEEFLIENSNLAGILSDLFFHGCSTVISVEFGYPMTFCPKSCCNLSAQDDHDFSLCLLNHLHWNLSFSHSFGSCELLAFLLVYKLDRMEEIQIKDLKEAFDGLVEDLLRRNRTINFLLDVSGGFQDALRALGKYLSINEMHLKVCNKLEKLTLISARVVEVFALEAIAGCSILTLIKVPLQNFSGFNAQILVDENEVRERTLDLINLMKNELQMAPPCVWPDRVVSVAIEALYNSNVITFEPEPLESVHFLRKPAKRLNPMSLSSCIDSNPISLPKKYVVSTRKDSVNHIFFLYSLLKDRFHDIYQVTSNLMSNERMSYDEFQSKVPLRFPSSNAVNNLILSGIVKISEDGSLELDDEARTSGALRKLRRHIQGLLMHHY